ncbi:MAG: hypothetical protein KC591_15260 [Gemmatimonadetes bacterium]|nr:hypothetical protein [Gemmatimonadota bacterium]
MSVDRRDLIAQWAFDTRSVLGRFHVWLEDVEEGWLRGRPDNGVSFVGKALEKSFVMSAAVTALGTKLFGRYGEANGGDKKLVNRVKKDADAISAYAMSEALWHIGRNLPENHAIMISLGEGLMPKAGETPEMGANPLLGFGRVYARPEVATFVTHRVRDLINRPGYGWERFWDDIKAAGITIWGAAVDTLENTSRFAKGSATGPMCVFHVFDQPLNVALPYEGYMGSLCVPNDVVRAATRRSVLVDYLTPRAKILEAIRDAYPDIPPANVHVFTLAGPSREARLRDLWDEWRELGVHVIEDGWMLPAGLAAFTESGTYAPTYSVGTFENGSGERHVVITDGYAASAEAIQAASLDPMRGQHTSLCVFSSRFEASERRERHVMQLDPAADDFATRLAETLGHPVGDADVADYREMIHVAAAAGMPLDKPAFDVSDLFPRKKWQGLAVAGFMLPDPYTGAAGVEDLGNGVYRVTVRAVSEQRTREVRVTLRLMETFEESRRVFSPLLDRLYAGESYRNRAVKVSDSGRIRNELMTWCSSALEHYGDNGMRVHLDQIDESVLPADKREFIREVLHWYKTAHPLWFQWLEIA